MLLANSLNSSRFISHLMNRQNCFIILILLISMGLSMVSCSGNGDDGLEKRIEETKHLQDHRKEIIDGMLDGGLATRIENPNSQPYIYVTEPFYMLTSEEQASLMNVVWYYFITQDRSSDVLTIYDNNTGEEKGTFSVKGLVMKE